LGEEKDMSEEDAMAILINWINKNKKGWKIKSLK
jgi:hypothetical protein